MTQTSSSKSIVVVQLVGIFYPFELIYPSCLAIFYPIFFIDLFSKISSLFDDKFIQTFIVFYSGYYP